MPVRDNSDGMQSSEQKRDYPSREVKFRAWDKRAKKWRAVHTLCLYEPETGKAGLNGAIVADDNSKQGTFMPIERLEVVQYTGHLSIDTVEVCNGDLLRYPGGTELFRVGWDDFEGAWMIFYEDVRCGFGIRMAQFMQIAGNVYSDPALKTKAHL